MNEEINILGTCMWA